MPATTLTMLSCSARRVASSQRLKVAVARAVSQRRWKSACEASALLSIDDADVGAENLLNRPAELQEEGLSKPLNGRNSHKEIESRTCIDLIHIVTDNEGAVQAQSVAPSFSRPMHLLHELPSLQILEGWAEDAQELLEYVLKQEQTSSPEFLSSLYLAAISAWVQCAKKHTKDVAVSLQHAERAHALLMQWYNESNDTKVLPSWMAHERVLHGWYRASRRSNDNQQQLLDPRIPAQRSREVLELLQQSQTPTVASKHMVHQVVELCCKVTTPVPSLLPRNALDRANAFLQEVLHASRLLQRLEEDNSPLDKNTRKSYKLILRALARTGKTADHTKEKRQEAISVAEQAAGEASRIVRRMQQRYGTHVTRNYHYTELIKAWSHVTTPSGTKRAHALLREAQESPHVVFPNTLPYFSVLAAYAKVAGTSPWTASSKGHPANQALQILNSMEEQWLQRPQGADKETGVAGNDGLQDETDSSDDETATMSDATVAPDALCYSTVLNALAKCRVRRKSQAVVYPADVATSLLDRMEHLYSTNALPGQPNLYCYGNVIKAWSNHPGDWDVAAKQAQNVLRRLEECFPKSTSLELKLVVEDGHISFWYNTVMRMIVKSKLPDAPQQVKAILTSMEDMYHDSVTSGSAVVVAPDSRSYHSAITAWARSEGTRTIARVHYAREVLDRMLDMHRYQQSLVSKGGAIKDSIALSCQPSVHCYNAVLIACSYTLGDQDKQEALQIAHEVFDQLCDSPYASPNAGTFGRMMQCLCRFLSPGEERDNNVLEMFRMCCEYGEVNDFVLGVLKENGSEPLWERVFGPELTVDFSKGKSITSLLPQEWTRKQRNVRY